MPDYIGNITVPEIVPSGVLPIVPDYPHGRAWRPDVAIHQFGSGNAKIEQRGGLALRHEQQQRAEAIHWRHRNQVPDA